MIKDTGGVRSSSGSQAMPSRMLCWQKAFGERRVTKLAECSMSAVATVAECEIGGRLIGHGEEEEAFAQNRLPDMGHV